jgi:hypothetical protein
MTTGEPRPVFHLPARDIPVPSSISAEAQAVLAMGPVGPGHEWPAADDLEGWRALVAEQAEQIWGTFIKAGTRPTATVADEIDLGGFTVYVILPDGVSPDDRRVYLDIHGGAWAFGGGEICSATLRASRPPSSSPGPATSCCRTRYACTGRYVPLACPPNCTCSKPPGTASSWAERPRTRTSKGKSAGSSTITGQKPAAERPVLDLLGSHDNIQVRGGIGFTWAYQGTET